MCPLKWQWASSLKKIKSNKPGLFSIFWLISWKNGSRSALFSSICKISILWGRAYGLLGSQKWLSGNVNFLWETTHRFSGRFLKPSSHILNVVGCFHWTRSTTVTFIGICDTSTLPKFDHQAFNCSSIRYFVPAKISPALQFMPQLFLSAAA